MNIFLVLTILSTVVLFGFIALSIDNFGILSSYSAYSTKWLEVFKKNSVWSYATMIAVLLIIPPLIEAGEGNYLQFLGFLSPVYLGIVALTPRWEFYKSEHIVHSLFAGLCAVSSILWAVLVTQTWGYIILWTLTVLLIALSTRTLIKSIVFHLEIIAFATIYTSLMATFI